MQTFAGFIINPVKDIVIIIKQKAIMVRITFWYSLVSQVQTIPFLNSLSDLQWLLLQIES